ncbi:MAG TPA: Asp23/Gls24 family envelope stress response protein [Rubrobacter sp.]|nr:Asp23/Gls24 family envelope stress response protein [Rubrobacter sp.]
MSAQRTQQKRSQEQNKNPLQSELGNTTIQDSVVSKIAGIAAQEVEGVRMGGGASQAVGGVLDTITGGRSGGSQTSGVSVEVGQEEAAIDLTMTVEYGKPIPQLAEAVRNNVVSRVESLVGLRVTETNITVQDVFFPGEGDQGQQ